MLDDQTLCLPGWTVFWGVALDGNLDHLIFRSRGKKRWKCAWTRPTSSLNQLAELCYGYMVDIYICVNGVIGTGFGSFGVGQRCGSQMLFVCCLRCSPKSLFRYARTSYIKTSNNVWNGIQPNFGRITPGSSQRCATSHLSRISDNYSSWTYIVRTPKPSNQIKHRTLCPRQVFQDFVVKTQKLPGFKLKFELPTEAGPVCDDWGFFTNRVVVLKVKLRGISFF